MVGEPVFINFAAPIVYLLSSCLLSSIWGSDKLLSAKQIIFHPKPVLINANVSLYIIIAITWLRKCLVSRVKGSTYWLTRVTEFFSHRKLQVLLNIPCLATSYKIATLSVCVMFKIKRSLTYFRGLCRCGTQKDSLLKGALWRTSSPETGMVWILQVISFLPWKLLVLFTKN